jgi:calcineurin-like phosphoesterase family protein
MRDKWLISDLHLGHANILNFIIEGEKKLRPGFASLDEMHQCIFDRWNDTVKQGDKVYVLGDVAFNQVGLTAMLEMAKLPGRKRLVLGNHDAFQIEHYRKVFAEIYGFRRLEQFWLSHAPVHPDTIGERAAGNIHGHLHSYEVKDDYLKLALGSTRDIIDHRYFNVSVERINYTPINLDVIREHMKSNGVPFPERKHR